MTMENLYQVLQDTSIKNLHEHEIKYFDTVIEEYPSDYKKIIAYCNECFNYRSPLIVEEKDWGIFLMERFRANDLPEDLYSALVLYESPEIVFAISSFLAHQKQPAFTTLIAKQNLRISMLSVMQSFSNTITEKKTANEAVTSLDNEINEIFERLRQEQKKFGNYKGYDAVKSARNKFKINIANFVE